MEEGASPYGDDLEDGFARARTDTHTFPGHVHVFGCVWVCLGVCVCDTDSVCVCGVCVVCARNARERARAWNHCIHGAREMRVCVCVCTKST